MKKVVQTLRLANTGKALFYILAFIFSCMSVSYCQAQTYVTAPLTTSTLAPGQYVNNNSILMSPGFSVNGTTGTYQFYITDCIPLATVPSAGQNYIMTNTPRIGGITTASGLANRNACDLMQTIQYLDGLGRPLQTVQVKGSPNGNDVVQPFTYDQFGREATKYLPYAITTGASDGSYKTDALTAGAGQSKFYNPAGSSATQQASGIVNTSYPFSATVFEPSPLNRVTEQGAAGAAWQPVPGSTAGHTVKVAYGSNASNDVILWAVNAAGNGLAGGSTYYDAGKLYTTTTTDENGFNTIEYKDLQGRVVCKKAQVTSAMVTYVATYYVYNNLNNLSYVVPPQPTGAAYPATIAETDPVCKNFIYCYHYDERDRLVQKRIPGKDWEYMVYNRLDQLVLSQDAVQRAGNVWTVAKYDASGREILTGLWTSAGQSQSTLQSSVYATPQWDTRNYADNVTGYSINSYPTPTKVLSINYYDDYNNIPGLPSAFVTGGFSANTNGLLTATKTAVLNTIGNTTPDMLNVAYGYDDFGRIVTTYKQHYLGGTLNPNNYDVITNNNYNFSNQLTSTTRQHYKNVSNTAVLVVTINNTYAYDHMGRKTQTKEQINSGPNIVLSQTDYNQIGQVMAKHLHQAPGSAAFLQDITYKYNERGWLKRINDPALAPTPTRLFSEQLNYDSLKYAVTTQNFNGNITEQMFQVYNSTLSGLQHVTYAYDPLNRLNNGTSSTGLTESGITYDNLGNITSLTRGANTGTYLYNGNQLNTVSGITTSAYTYDANGNVYHDGRTGAGITSNMLNLPQAVTGTNINITYTYDAEGQKLRKVSTASGVTTNTDYIGGIQYKTDEATIDFIQTEEGRAINAGSSYNYEYTLTDHLGNNRVTFDQVTGKVGEEDYYPFGLNFDRLLNAGNKYLYNKKELQPEITEYDYGARFYDPVIGRWNTIDPLAEFHYDITPFNYVLNNPIANIDLFGLDTVKANTPSAINPGDVIVLDNGTTSTAIIGDVKITPNGSDNSDNSDDDSNTAPAPTIGFDFDKQAVYLDKHSFSHYIPGKDKNGRSICGHCALHVRLSLEAGGLNMKDRPKSTASAKNYGPYLIKKGYKVISPDNYNPKKGDIRVWQPYPGGDPNGHIDAYDGKQWVSDFKEANSAGPGPGYRQFPDFEIYRRGQ